MKQISTNQGIKKNAPLNNYFISNEQGHTLVIAFFWSKNSGIGFRNHIWTKWNFYPQILDA